MSPLPKGIQRRDLIKRMRELGWEGPRRGTNHQFMVKGKQKVRIPNVHKGGGTIGKGLLAEILRQAGISPDEW